jgi:DNA sulfur modification protein DndC
VENMLAQNPGRYPYLVPLLELRNFLSDTQWDWSRRNFIGRTISPEGKIKVGADQYSPQMVEDLLYYTARCTSARERVRFALAGACHRVQRVDRDRLLLVVARMASAVPRASHLLRSLRWQPTIRTEGRKALPPLPHTCDR